jgi:FMNH2-dependent dimethyl sulfone monooxygenase
MTIKIGIYLPVYGGWFPSEVKEEEKAPTFEYVKQVALKAERMGVDYLWIPDHLLNPLKGEMEPSLEAWTLATAICEATERIKVSHTTLCESFRYPAVLAKSAATLNEISSGRFILSLGAGWFDREYESYGLLFYEHYKRIARAKEAIQIIKRMWREENVSYHGKYYSIDNGNLEPKPNPIPPIWYAGMTEASRQLISEEVDGWLMKACNLKEAKENIVNMNQRLEAKNRPKIEYSIPALTFIRDTDDEAKKHGEQLLGEANTSFNRVMDTGLVGSYETVYEKIGQLEDIGMDHVIFQLTPTFEELDNIKHLLDIMNK